MEIELKRRATLSADCNQTATIIDPANGTIVEQGDRSREMMIQNESIYDNPINENEEDVVKMDLDNVK